MTVGMSTSTANSILDAICNGVSYSVGTLYIQLHVGDPGAAGTSNPATETSRKAAGFGAPSGGSIANDTAVQWTGIAGAQDATHWSGWTLSSGGTFVGSGTITANAYSAGDTYTAGIGAFTLSLTVAS